MAPRLKFSDKAPLIAAEWSPKNDVSPNDVLPSDLTPRTWVCPNGHEWVASVNVRVYKGRKCGECPRKPITEYAPEVLPQWSPRNHLSPAFYGVSSREAVWWFNASCGHEWEQAPIHRIGGNACPVCSGHIVVTGSNDLATVYPSVAAEWSPRNKRKVTDVAAHSNRDAEWVCAKDSRHVWTATISTRTSNGAGCPFCSGRKPLKGVSDLSSTHPQLKARWSPKNTLSIDEVSHGSHHIVEWVCPKGHPWKAAIYNVVNGSGCPTCYGRVVLEGDNDIATTHPHIAAQWHSSNIASPKAVTAGARTPIRWQCEDNPSHNWVASPFNRTNPNNPTGCPDCWSSKMVSKAESEVFEFVKSELRGADVVQGYRHLKDVHEVDIYIPSLKIAIEYNGVYWHSDKSGKGNLYHWGKRKACEANGVRLITVWEDDWSYRREVVKDMLKSRIGTYRGPKYSARVLEWRRVPPSEASSFLENNHIQGGVKATRHDGLFTYAGELVALMSTTTSGDTYTIERFATQGNVRGAFGKLLNVLENRVKADGGGTVRTFADLSISNGDLYRSHGFEEDKELKPAYWVVVGNRRYHTLSFKKDRFRTDPALKWDPHLSVEKLIDLNGLSRVYDAGKLRFVKKVTQ